MIMDEFDAVFIKPEPKIKRKDSQDDVRVKSKKVEVQKSKKKHVKDEDKELTMTYKPDYFSTTDRKELEKDEKGLLRLLTMK